jgi:iron complex transport system ATP-binding protein
MTSEPVIELTNVGYCQRTTQILTDINWSLYAGEHWAVLGPNGSGKTTLLKIACGYLWPSGGRVRRLGQELIDLRELRKQIGWITSDLAAQIPGNDTALETVVTGRLAQFGLKLFPGFEPTEQDFVDARDMLLGLGCVDLIEKPFGVLSQGERQQVLIARARMAEPLLMVLDEPCAGMDPGVRERFLYWLNQHLSSPNSPTVVLVTHHVEEIVSGIRQTLMLSEGRIYASGRTREIVTRETIEKVYGVRLHALEEFAGRLWPIWDSAIESPRQ